MAESVQESDNLEKELEDGVNLNDEDVFEVEKIVGIRTIGDKTLYRVRWLGYGPQQDTWEPYDNLLTCKDLIDRYIANRKSCQKKQKAGKWIMVSVDDEGNQVENGTDENCTGLGIRDTFWKNLEAGRINVFEGGDMYTKVKGRATRPPSYNENALLSRPNSNTSISSHEPSVKKKRLDNKGNVYKKRKSRRKKMICYDEELQPQLENGDLETSLEADLETSLVADLETSLDADLEMSLDAEMKDEDDKPCSSKEVVKVEPVDDPPKEEPNCSDSVCSDTLSVKEEKVELQDEEEKLQKNSEDDIKDIFESNLCLNNILNEKDCLEFDDSFKDLFLDSTQIQSQKKDDKFESDDFKFDLDNFDPDQWIPEEFHNQIESTHITNAELCEAVQVGDYEKVKKAIGNSDYKYDVEQPDTSGMTLLMAAAMSGFDEIVELLVMHGADINATHKSGNTALMLSSDKGNVCTVAVLIQLGAHLDVQQYTGETALMKASKRGHTGIVRCLLENGSNFSVSSHHNYSALSLAKVNNHMDCYDWITNHATRVTDAFETQVNLTLNNTATIQHALFQLQCFSLSQGPTFPISFHHNLQPLNQGVGMLLFIAHARITPIEVKCRLFGPCAVVTAYLNEVKLNSLTEESQFVLSFCPLKNGQNNLVINCIPTPSSKCKLLVCAYQAKLTNRCHQNAVYS